MSEGDPQADFLDGLTLSPDWAKKSAESHASKLNKYSSRNEREPRDTRRGKAPFRHDRNRDDSRGRGDERRQRPRGRTERPDFGGDPRRDLTASPTDSPRRDFAAPPADSPRREPVATQQEGAGRPRRDFDRRGRQPPPPVPFDIRFLPDQKALSVIARKVQGGHRAIPLRDLVKLFFDNPDSVEVRLEFNAENKDRRFHSCGKCGWFALSEEALRGHILTTYFDEYFDSETITVDPPTGNFTGVGRCGFTGKLLAPPNHHSYNKVIQQMLRTECAGTSEEAYRARIEFVNTPEAIEQWKQEASQQVVYFAKPDPENVRKRTPKKKTADPVAKEGPVAEAESGDEALPLADQTQPEEVVSEAQERVEADLAVGDESLEEAELVQRMSAEEAEDLFSRTLMPKLMKTERRVTVTHAVSKTISDRNVLDAISRAWDREQVIQTASLFFAVRGGLRSRKLALFRASDPRREEFVIHKKPTPLDPAHAAPELKQIIDYLTEHPGCTKTSLLADLIPSDAAPEKAERVLKQVAFFIERGHMIEYFNGVLALAAAHPHYSAPSDTKKKQRKPKDSVQHAGDTPTSATSDVPVKPKAKPEPVAEPAKPEPAKPEPVAEPAKPEPAKPEPEVASAEAVVDPEPVVELEKAPEEDSVAAEPVDAPVEPEPAIEPAVKLESVTAADDVESSGENVEAAPS